MIASTSVVIPHGDPSAIIEAARRAEALVYSSLLIPDHLFDQVAPLTALAAVSAVTDRLRLGPFVLNNDLRHPVVVAQELANIDRISAGRLEIGIGAGWNEPEYRTADRVRSGRPPHRTSGRGGHHPEGSLR